MNTLLRTSIAVGILSPSAIAHAQPRPGFELGAAIADYSYQERVDGAVIVRDDGTMGKFYVGYVETLGATTFLRARYDIAAGDIDYRADDGSTLADVPQTVGQLEIHLGTSFQLGRSTVSPFIGIGSRVLFDESGDRVSSSGDFGYDREIVYGFVPIGLSLDVPIGSKSGLIVSGQWNQVIDGSSKSKFSSIDPELPDIDLNLTGGHGYEFSGIVRIPVGRHEIRFGPALRHWRLKQSETQTFVEPEGTVFFYEPPSRTTELSLRIGFAF